MILIDMRRLRPLRPAELHAWQRWHKNMRQGQVLVFLLKHGRFPVIQGGLT